MKRMTLWGIAAAAAVGALAMAETPRHAPWRSAEAAEGEVGIRIFAYKPLSLTVAKGTTVTWSNGDEVTHTVTSGAPGKKEARFAGRLEGKGAAYRHTFAEAGTYTYFCERHQAMTGEIVVK